MASSEGPVSGTYWTELRIYLQVAHARSYHRAAQQLDLSHPTVSRAVTRLEKALGVRLVDEATAHGVTLTEVGARLAREIATFDIGLADVLRSIVPSEAEPVTTTLPPMALPASET